MCIRDSTSTDNVTYTNFGSASASATSLSVTGLTPSTQYWFRVAAVNTAGTSSYATSSTLYTLANTPSGFTATLGGNNAITVSWTGDATSYYVSHSGANSGWITTTSYEFTGLSCGNNYTFTVKGKNGNNDETSTASVSQSTSGCGSSGSGSRMSRSQLERILAPSTTTTAYLNSLPPDNRYQTPITQPNTTGTSTPFIFLKNLKIKDRNTDVLKLQQYLNNYAVYSTTTSTTTYPFRVSITGPGSPNNETTYFGLATYYALIKFQEYYKDRILTPYGLNKGTGFFGPATRRVVNGF